jgi:sulfotransferase family protein
MSAVEDLRPVPEPVFLQPTLQEYEQLLEARRRHLVIVNQPIVLISQAPRSGGTLLLRLFDGHRSLHVVPWELSLDMRSNLDNCAEAWERLHDDSLEAKFAQGFSQSHPHLNGDRTRYPLHVAPSFMRGLYEEAIAVLDRPSERGLRNAYLTALFNAWLDNQNFYSRKAKSWVVIFTPRMIANNHKMANFRRVYPDGRVISIVRDPLSWFTSARRWSHSGEWARPEEAMTTWCRSVEAALARHEAQPDTTAVVLFKDLIRKTRPTMTMLCRQLGIRFSKDIVTPTVNRLPVRANSSFPSSGVGITRIALKRHETELTSAEADYVRRRGRSLYKEAHSRASRPACA